MLNQWTHSAWRFQYHGKPRKARPHDLRRSESLFVCIHRTSSRRAGAVTIVFVTLHASPRSRASTRPAAFYLRRMEAWKQAGYRGSVASRSTIVQFWRPGRHRACPSNSQEAILVRPRSISELRVAKTALGSSTRVVLCLGVNLKRAGPALKSFRDPNFERL
jgi:hypothetical protein